MDLFCFASRNVENIHRGFAARKWAVATVSDSPMRGRVTKAAKYFHRGAKGILYCGPTHSFTVPFIVRSPADPLAVVKDIWPEPWVLPFDIEPLGRPERQIHMDRAVREWPLLLRRGVGRGGVTAALNITGATVFVPVDVTTEEWEAILRDLSC